MAAGSGSLAAFLGAAGSRGWRLPARACCRPGLADIKVRVLHPAALLVMLGPLGSCEVWMHARLLYSRMLQALHDYTRGQGQQVCSK